MSEVEYVYTKQEEPTKKSRKKLLLIVIAVVVIVALIMAYLFLIPMLLYAESSKEFEKLSEEAYKTTEETANAFKLNFALDAVSYEYDLAAVNIRNTGEGDIDLSTISASVDGVEKSIVGNNGMLSPGQVAYFNVMDIADSCDKVLSIRLHTGLSESALLVC